LLGDINLVVWDVEAVINNGESHLSWWAEVKLLKTKVDHGRSITSQVGNVGGGELAGV